MKNIDRVTDGKSQEKQQIDENYKLITPNKIVVGISSSFLDTNTAQDNRQNIFIANQDKRAEKRLCRNCNKQFINEQSDKKSFQRLEICSNCNQSYIGKKINQMKDIEHLQKYGNKTIDINSNCSKRIPEQLQQNNLNMKKQKQINEKCYINFKQNDKWERCPRCKLFQKKIQSTNYIKCSCSHQFCFYCSSNWSNQHERCTSKQNFYVSQQQNQKYIFFTKYKILEMTMIKRIPLGILLFFYIPFWFVLNLAIFIITFVIKFLTNFIVGPIQFGASLGCPPILCPLYYPICLVLSCLMTFILNIILFLRMLFCVCIIVFNTIFALWFLKKEVYLDKPLIDLDERIV